MVDQSVIPDLSFDRDLTYFSDISGMLYKVNSKINASNGQDLYYHIGINAPKKWKFKVVMYDYITKKELKTFEKDDSGTIEFTGNIKVEKNMKIGMVLYAYDYFSDVWVNKDFIGFWYINVSNDGGGNQSGEDDSGGSSSKPKLSVYKVMVNGKRVYKDISRNYTVVETDSNSADLKLYISNSGDSTDNGFAHVKVYDEHDFSTLKEYRKKFSIDSFGNTTVSFNIPLEYDNTVAQIEVGYDNIIQWMMKILFKHKDEKPSPEPPEPQPQPQPSPEPPEPQPQPQPSPEPPEPQPQPQPSPEQQVGGQINSALVIYLYRDIGIRGIKGIVSDGKNTKTFFLSKTSPYYIIFSDVDKQYTVYLKKWIRWKGVSVSKDNPNASVRGLSWIVYVTYVTGDKAREIYNKLHS